MPVPDPASVLLHTVHRPHRPGLGPDLTAQIRRWRGEVIRVPYQLATLVEGVTFSVRWLAADAAALRTAASLGFDVSACQADVADPIAAERYSIAWETDTAPRIVRDASGKPYVRAVVIACELCIVADGVVLGPPREVHASPWTTDRSFALDVVKRWAQENGLVPVARSEPDAPAQVTDGGREG